MESPTRWTPATELVRPQSPLKDRLGVRRESRGVPRGMAPERTLLASTHPGPRQLQKRVAAIYSGLA